MLQNCAKIANKEAIKYSRNCAEYAELRTMELICKGFSIQKSIILNFDINLNLCSRYKKWTVVITVDFNL